MRTSAVLALIAAGVSVNSTVAQETDGTGYVHLGLAEEIALARSAAPAEVSAEATIWAIREGRYQVVHEGRNANHCFVARTYPRSLEPVCYDAEGAKTILPMEIKQFDLRRQGHTAEEIDAAIAQAFGSGELAVPRRAAMSYMMSSGQVLFNTQGQPAGNWKPHLMMYIPYITHADIGVPAPLGDIVVVNEGKPNAYIVIVVSDFVHPVTGESGN